MTATASRMTGSGEQPQGVLMGATAPVRVIRPADHTLQTAQTPGFVRRMVVAAPGTWIGITRTPAGSTSGWHHHGDYETYIYVQSGQFQLHFGPGGEENCLGEAGDMLVVPKGAIHRETNPGDDENVALIIRVGTGEPVFNVDEPGC
jgi:uncharacterized RmlC-like cupin family protein